MIFGSSYSASGFDFKSCVLLIKLTGNAETYFFIIIIHIFGTNLLMPVHLETRRRNRLDQICIAEFKCEVVPLTAVEALFDSERRHLFLFSDLLPRSVSVSISKFLLENAPSASHWICRALPGSALVCTGDIFLLQQLLL